MAERSSWAERRAAVGLDTPQEARRRWVRPPSMDPEAFGRAAEGFARFMGTARFLVYMTAFVTLWLAWNTFAPGHLQFDPKSLNYTLLTLMLSLQASYAAPLILLAQNRQTDRERVIAEQDRARDERALADTEYLTREVAALRIALRDVTTRDFVRAELRSVLEELRDDEEGPAPKRKGGKGKKGQGGKGGGETQGADPEPDESPDESPDEGLDEGPDQGPDEVGAGGARRTGAGARRRRDRSATTTRPVDPDPGLHPDAGSADNS